MEKPQDADSEESEIFFLDFPQEREVASFVVPSDTFLPRIIDELSPLFAFLEGIGGRMVMVMITMTLFPSLF